MKFLHNQTIKNKIIFAFAIFMTLFAVIFATKEIMQYKSNFNEQVRMYKQEAYKNKKEELKNYSAMANKVLMSYYNRTKKDKILAEVKNYIDEQSDYLFNIINRYYKDNHNKMDNKTLQKELLKIIKSARYGKSGYFWVNDFNYKMIMHPIKPEYDNKYFKSDPKVPFVALGVDALKKNRSDKAYIQYSFYSPSSKTYQEKASVVRVFKPFNWIIGTGAYIDDLTQKMQKEALNAIKNMRYGKNGYFWINDMNNKMLMHPIKPEYDNKYFINTPKVPFVELGTKKLLSTKQHSAFIEYSFYTPATKKYSHKLSIVEKFEPWGWVVGTGVYTDYIDAKILKEKNKAYKETNQIIAETIIMIIVILVLLIVLSSQVINKIIIIPLEKFQSGLKQFFKYLKDDKTTVKKLPVISNDEIGHMSHETNIAIESAMKIHNELKELKEQLEQKVETTSQDLNKTKQEFQNILKNTNESLEYGALIQSSILPDDKLFKEAFTNYFILNTQVNIINSDLYMFEKIRSNEYVYAIVNTKRDGISAVFVSMLINAVFKQAITQLKYERDDTNENASSWLLGYLNNNLELKDNGIEAAVLYYHKDKNIIKYSASNIALHYYQNDAFHILKPSDKLIGVEKDIDFQEHTIIIGEYIELYLSTNQYIRNNIDAYEFNSPFLTDTNNFKENLSKMQSDTLVAGFQIDNKPQVIIEYEGEFTQKLVNEYVEQIEDKIDNIGLMSNISTTFVEQYQNILNYAKSEDQNITSVHPFGYIKLQKNVNNTYSIESVNIVTIEDKQKIEPKLFEISELDAQGIRKRYRELRKSGKNTHAKGGGIGFYEIAKRCKSIEYHFKQINETRFEFKFISVLSAEKQK